MGQLRVDSSDCFRLLQRIREHENRTFMSEKWYDDFYNATNH